MHMSKTRILLKLTGEIFLSKNTGKLSVDYATELITQIKQLLDTYFFGIVIGGGNFFRGNSHGHQLGLTSSASHQMGMLGTIMNGIMLKDLCEKQGVAADVLTTMPNPEIGKPISQEAINSSLQKNSILIFAGGTGNPFFTTDTNAILRGLQIRAQEVWKGTSVDGIYTADPRKNPDACLLQNIPFSKALDLRLGVMDLSAFAMAEQHHIPIRIFNIFTDNALLKAAQNKEFGSTIS